MAEEEKKKVSPVTLAATALAAVTAMIIGSFFGTGGTVWGVALGPIVSGACATWYENWTRTAHAKVRARKEVAAQRYRRDDGTLFGRVMASQGGEVKLVNAHARRQLSLDGWRWGRRLGFAGLMAGLCLAVTLVTLTGVEAATGRTFATTFSSRPEHGTTLGGWTAPSPSVTPSLSSPGVTPTGASPDPSPSSSAPSPSPDASPDASPDESPSGVSTSPAPGGSGIIGSP